MSGVALLNLLLPCAQLVLPELHCSDEHDPKCDPKHPTEHPWSGEDMGEGSGAWRGEVRVCCRDTICFLLSQQQLQTFVLMGFGFI